MKPPLQAKRVLQDFYQKLLQERWLSPTKSASAAKLISIRRLSRSLKLMPLKSLGAVSYSPSIVTMAVSATILEIFSVKEWPDLEIWVWGPSRCRYVEYLSESLTGCSLQP